MKPLADRVLIKVRSREGQTRLFAAIHPAVSHCCCYCLQVEDTAAITVGGVILPDRSLLLLLFAQQYCPPLSPAG